MYGNKTRAISFTR